MCSVNKDDLMVVPCVPSSISDHRAATKTDHPITNTSAPISRTRLDPDPMTSEFKSTELTIFINHYIVLFIAGAKFKRILSVINYINIDAINMHAERCGTCSSLLSDNHTGQPAPRLEFQMGDSKR